MKKNKMMRLASVLLVAVLLSTCAISGTFAKYAATITNADTARVAEFKVSAFGEEVDEITDTVTVDLWKIGEVYDSEGIAGDDYTAAAPVQDGNIDQTEYLMAPGSWGKFSYTVVNESEVNVTYTVTYLVEEEGVPLQWSTDGKTWTDDLANVTATALNMGNDNTITIYWRWAFGDPANNSSDTTLGLAPTLATPSIEITVGFEQVD